MCNKCYEESDNRWKARHTVDKPDDKPFSVGDIVTWKPEYQTPEGYYGGFWTVIAVNQESRGITTYKLERGPNTFNRALYRQLDLYFTI